MSLGSQIGKYQNWLMSNTMIFITRAFEFCLEKYLNLNISPRHVIFKFYLPLFLCKISSNPQMCVHVSVSTKLPFNFNFNHNCWTSLDTQLKSFKWILVNLKQNPNLTLLLVLFELLTYTGSSKINLKIVFTNLYR